MSVFNACVSSREHAISFEKLSINGTSFLPFLVSITILTEKKKLEIGTYACNATGNISSITSRSIIDVTHILKIMFSV